MTKGPDTAHPVKGLVTNNWGEPVTAIDQLGLTKREYFAVMALQGCLTRGGTAEFCAKQALKAADELIKELNS